MTNCRRIMCPLAVVALLFSGCGGSSTSHESAAKSAATLRPALRLTPPAKRSKPRDRFATGLPSERTTSTSSRSQLPPAPGTLAALAAASIPAVVGLHNLASSAGLQAALPGGALKGAARDERVRLARLRRQVRAARGAGSGRLESTLHGYQQLAEALAGTRRPPAAASKNRLLALDAAWRGSLRAIGRASKTNLVADVPTLLVPRTPGPQAPPRKAVNAP